MPDNNERPPYPAEIPTGDAYKELVDYGHRWRVTPASLGGLLEGSIVGVKDFQPGACLQYLIDHGYLLPLLDSEVPQYAESAPRITPQPYHQMAASKPVDVKAETADAKPEATPAPDFVEPPSKGGRSNR